MYNFENTLIRCSCLSQIMTSPRLKKDKEAGNLSATAKSHLIKVYAWEKYGRKQDLQTLAVKKGLLAEEQAIDLISVLDKKMYVKNDVRLTNKWFTGEPDIFEGKSIKKADRVIDTKCSLTIETFLANLSKPLINEWYFQGQGYCDLTNASEFEVSVCLVNAPQILIDDEKRKLFYKMNVATEQNQDYLAACEELERNMVFDDIPMEERRIKFQINKDKEAIERAREKVVRCREWLAEFQVKHLAGGFVNTEDGEDGE